MTYVIFRVESHVSLEEAYRRKCQRNLELECSFATVEAT